MHEIVNNDCLNAMQGYASNHFTGIVCDPPYFLTNNCGSGFMGRSWDSLKGLSHYLWTNTKFVSSAVDLLLSTKVVQDSDEESIVPANVSMNILKSDLNQEEIAQCAQRDLSLEPVLKKDSVHLIVVTKQEALDWLKELSPSHIELIESRLSGEEKKCSICGSDFIAGKRNQQRCSVKCWDVAKSRMFRGKGNPSYINGNSANKRTYRGEDWGECRKKAYKRDEWSCRLCGKRCTRKEIQCHHIVPYKKGGTNDMDNLVTLCNKCHPAVEKCWKFYNREFFQTDLGRSLAYP